VKAARERDPIGLLEKRLLALGVADEAALEKIRNEEKAVVDEAVRFAETSPEPPISELYTDVYSGEYISGPR
jgi:pyruvate dehydrogenase E1 component alpha subunit